MAIFEIPEKVCPHCGGTRWSVEPRKTGFVRYRCPVLAQERRKRWKANNPDRVKVHQQTNHEKRMAAQYFKKRREKIKQSINQQLNSKNMATNKFFYNWKEIKELKDLIRTGEPIAKIARREYERFGTTELALRMKMYQLAKSTNKVREWDGFKTKRKTAPVAAKVTTPAEPKGVLVPEGTTFEGQSKRVVIFPDHFRIYF